MSPSLNKVSYLLASTFACDIFRIFSLSLGCNFREKSVDKEGFFHNYAAPFLVKAFDQVHKRYYLTHPFSFILTKAFTKDVVEQTEQYTSQGPCFISFS